MLNGHRNPQTENDAKKSTYTSEENSLDEKLHHNIRLTSTESPANANLPSAFGNTGKHDVHDANTAHKQRYRCYTSQDYAENLLGSLCLLQEFDRNDDAPVIFFMIGLHEVP